MTPAETYAQTRADAEALIRQYAPARLQDAVIEKLLPAIALSATRADDDAIVVGASKFGGAPDVPAGFEWPHWNEKPLGFMAQINLDEIAPFDIGSQLPSSGLLSFFYFMADEDDWPWGEIEQAGGWRVFHFQQELHRAAVPPNSQGDVPLATATLSPRAKWSVVGQPYYVTGEQMTDWPEEEVDNWFELREEMKSDAPQLMLGYPNDIQDDARLEAATRLQRGDFNDWHLLLQLDTDDEIDWMWGDGGAIFYLIHRDDLAHRQWDKCWLIAQCC